jgi:hypothetical protein
MLESSCSGQLAPTIGAVIALVRQYPGDRERHETRPCFGRKVQKIGNVVISVDPSNYGKEPRRYGSGVERPATFRPGR